MDFVWIRGLKRRASKFAATRPCKSDVTSFLLSLSSQPITSLFRFVPSLSDGLKGARQIHIHRPKPFLTDSSYSATHVTVGGCVRGSAMPLASSSFLFPYSYYCRQTALDFIFYSFYYVDFFRMGSDVRGEMY